MFLFGGLGFGFVLAILILCWRQNGTGAMICWFLAGPMLAAAPVLLIAIPPLGAALGLLGLLFACLGFAIGQTPRSVERAQWAAQERYNQRYREWKEQYHPPSPLPTEYEWAQYMRETFEQRHPRPQVQRRTN